MMDTWVLVAGLVLQAATIIGGVIWQLSNAKTDMLQKMHESVEQERRIIGESLAALRQKIADVELTAANTYIRRDGFYKVQEQFSTEIKGLREQIDNRFIRMEEKIDRLKVTGS